MPTKLVPWQYLDKTDWASALYRFVFQGISSQTVINWANGKNESISCNHQILRHPAQHMPDESDRDESHGHDLEPLASAVKIIKIFNIKDVSKIHL